MIGKNFFKLTLASLFITLLTACNPDNTNGNHDGNNDVSSKVWDVETHCGGSVNTEVFVGTVNYLVWVKNSSESECTVTVKDANRAVDGGIGNGRIYNPGSHKVYTQVNVPQGSQLRIFCSGDDEEKPCKFDYGVQRL